MTQYFNLKCKYFEKAPMRFYPGEYVVTFKCLETKNPKPIIEDKPWPPEGEEWCIVPRENVKPGDNNEGLVKIIINDVDFDKGTVVVGLYNSPDERIDLFKVPISEIPRA